MLILLLITIAIVILAGICFWAIDKFVSDARLGWLLKAFVVVIFAVAILQKWLPVLGVTL